MRKTITYEDYKKFSGESNLDFEQAIDLFESMNWNKGTFFYFPITDINLFQITHHKDNQFLIEISNDSNEMIYHQKYASQEKCKEIIRELYDKEKLEHEFISGFYKVPIISKTLDDIINGK